MCRNVKLGMLCRGQEEVSICGMALHMHLVACEALLLFPLRKSRELLLPLCVCY